MTLNHQNNIRNEFSSQNERIPLSKSQQNRYYTRCYLYLLKSTFLQICLSKEVLHSYLHLLKIIFRNFDLRIDLFTLKMILNHQNNIRNELPSHNYTEMNYYTITGVTSFICWKILFSLI